MTAMDDRDADAPTGWIRVAIGLAQGLAAWSLIHAAGQPFSSQHPQLFAALVLVAAFPPLIVLAGLGRMRLRVLLGWTFAAAAALALLAVYDLWREPLTDIGGVRRWPSPQLAFLGGVAVYIAHHLIEPADIERRWSPSYRGRFESAWRHGFQLALAVAFSGVFWGVLQLGAALFDMIGVKAVGQLFRRDWYIYPVTGAVFAAAVHLTDVRPGLIRGVRTVGLTLLAWLLPLMAGLTAAFLVALVFTGIEPLWATRRASSLLLSAVAVLIVLLNAAYQDGGEREGLPPILRWAGRGAALLLAPLTVLAAWATALRIGQYGLTPERVYSLAVLFVAALYAAGYAWAAVTRGAWMKRLETVNVVAAVAMVATILLLLSPVADPARLSVSDQVKRLQDHRTTAGKFDFKFLRFNAARFGREALDRLARSNDPKVAAAARAAQALKTRFGPASELGAPLSGAVVLPTGTTLPDSFRRQVFTGAETDGLPCLSGAARCEVYPKDIDGDGAPEVLISRGGVLSAFALGADGRWTAVGRYTGLFCDNVRQALEKGELGTAPPAFNDLQIAGQRLSFQQDDACNLSVKAPLLRETRPGALGPAFRGR